MKYTIIVYGTIIILLAVIFYSTGIFNSTNTLNISVSYKNPSDTLNNLNSAVNSSSKYPIIARITPDISCGKWCVAELLVSYDGTVSYDNREWDNFFNHRQSNISQEELAQLQGLFEKNEFFSLNMTYDCDNRLSDAQEISYTYQDGAINKAVYVYEGCNLPPGLKTIDDELNIIQARLG